MKSFKGWKHVPDLRSPLITFLHFNMNSLQALENSILSRFDEIVLAMNHRGHVLPPYNNRTNPTERTTQSLQHIPSHEPVQLSQEEKKRKRRNDCRLHQQRYRQHQREVIAALEKECQELKWQKARLEEKKSLAASQIIARQTNFHDKAYSMALSYFQTMMHGISLTNCDRRESQIEFLRSAFREDLLLEGGFAGSHGVNGLIDQFVKYTKFHKSFHMAVSNFTVCGDNTLAVVRNKVITTLVISRESIAGIYPHVMSDEVLVQRIIGKKIVVYGTTIFYCNDKGQIEKFDCTIDYAGAWTNLLGDLDTVISFLEEAKISGSLIEPEEGIQ